MQTSEIATQLKKLAQEAAGKARFTTIPSVAETHWTQYENQVLSVLNQIVQQSKEMLLRKLLQEIEDDLDAIRPRTRD